MVACIIEFVSCGIAPIRTCSTSIIATVKLLGSVLVLKSPTIVTIVGPSDSHAIQVYDMAGDVPGPQSVCCVGVDRAATNYVWPGLVVARVSILVVFSAV